MTDRAGVAHERPLPAFVRRPLTRRLPAPAGRRSRSVRGGRTATLFVDCFVQYQEPGVGEALARLLAAAGVRLELADVGCCGRTALSTGQIEKARAAARRALDALHPLAADGAEILFVEPSCLSMVRDDWTRLLPDDARVAEVAAASRPALALVADLAAEGRLHFRAGGRALLHCHCHEKALGFAGRHARRARRPCPASRSTTRTPAAAACPASSGTRPSTTTLSVAMAERALLPAVRAARPETAVLATGTSCRSQVARPRRPRRRPPARVPRRPPPALTRRSAAPAVRARGRPDDGRPSRRDLRPCTMTLVNWVILIAGVAGLLVAGYGLVALTQARGAHAPLRDIAIADRGRRRWSSCCWSRSATVSSADPARARGSPAALSGAGAKVRPGVADTGNAGRRESAADARIP